MNEAEIDTKMNALRQDADQAASQLAFIRSNIDNPVIKDRLDGSTSGYAWQVAKAGVEQSLILYCARAWDLSRDAISLPILMARFPSLADVKKKRDDWHKKMGIANAPALDTEYAAFAAAYKTAKEHDAHAHLRVLRSEHFAHRVLLSRDRQKFEASGPIIDATINDLVSLADQTVRIVGDMGYLWDGLVNPYPDMIARSEGYCREFWEHLPVYRNLEKSD
ncbi:hypothetical protein SAMN05428967_3369 [Phyllobacterium sp. YR620]|uniref:AbiU2 domain-containing protein n=1 Tax=Phyllobacterium sp. YR620 TaxID=1881066 RepID=UPI00088360B0|nr:hypothetical protein [Phyllobacterium sp. YR620]SDP77334.1 hypothetical protein SAMN05428967_3369 [Phyllobacterium sp. YR620]